MTPAPGVGRPAFTPHSQPPPPTSRRRAEEEMMGEPSTAAVAKAHASQPRAARPAQAPTRAATEPASSLDGEDF